MIPAKNHQPRRQIGGRILLFLVGSLLILMALLNVFLFIFGQTSHAEVHTRRFGGAKDGYGGDKRYEWSIDYSFQASDGGLYHGTTVRRGSDLQVQVEKTVYYLPALPQLNTLEKEVKPNLGQLILLGLGLFLIVVSWSRPHKD